MLTKDRGEMAGITVVANTGTYTIDHSLTLSLSRIDHYHLFTLAGGEMAIFIMAIGWMELQRAKVCFDTKLVIDEESGMRALSKMESKTASARIPIRMAGLMLASTV